MGAICRIIGAERNRKRYLLPPFPYNMGLNLSNVFAKYDRRDQATLCGDLVGPIVTAFHFLSTEGYDGVNIGNYIAITAAESASLSYRPFLG